MTFVEILNHIIDFFGIFTFDLIFISASIGLWNYVLQLLKKQKKIKCLCKHEFEVEFITDYTKKRVYDLKCRKCGKTKSVTVYCKEESDLR